MKITLNEKTLPHGEVILSTSKNRVAIHRAVKKGLLRELAGRLYTPDLTTAPELIVRGNIWQITALYFPGAVIADRTAIESRPATDGSVFLVTPDGGRAADVALPGFTLRPRVGTPPVEGDVPFISGLWMSSQARALLENMRPSRKSSRVSRTLSQKELEGWIEGLLRKGGGMAAINRIRDEARRIAPELGLVEEAEKLSGLIGAILGTHDASLVSEVGKARALGFGFDPERIVLFDQLRAVLANEVFEDIPDKGNGAYQPFFEAYFSNFIEGTEFSVKEAYSIVFDGVIPKARPEDAHDILGTFRVVSDSRERSQVAHNSEDYMNILRYRHSIILGGRHGMRPGEFKTMDNSAGGTDFVSVDLVEGTLIRGFEMLDSIQSPMGRAIFAMFLISEVHPFSDGNGRVARVAMNAELSHAGQTRIIIPTVFRTEYLQSLKALTQNGRASALIRVLSFAQTYSSLIDFSEYDGALQVLRETNAFKNPADAWGGSDKLKLPPIVV